jgi:hypothetical protein
MHWGAIAVAVLGLVLVFAPVLAKWWTDYDTWVRCPACHRELIGYPAEHREADRLHCRQVIAARRAGR